MKNSTRLSNSNWKGEMKVIGRVYRAQDRINNKLKKTSFCFYAVQSVRLATHTSFLPHRHWQEESNGGWCALRKPPTDAMVTRIDNKQDVLSNMPLEAAEIDSHTQVGLFLVFHYHLPPDRSVRSLSGALLYFPCISIIGASVSVHCFFSWRKVAINKR